MSTLNPNDVNYLNYTFKKYHCEKDKVKELIFSILESYGLPLDPGHTDKDLDTIEETYFEDRGYFEVVYDKKNELVGTWALARITEETVELRKMYLSAKDRGKGLGKMMLDRALQKARALKYEKVELETASVLKEAIKLYESYGFKKLKKENLSDRCNQVHELDLRKATQSE